MFFVKQYKNVNHSLLFLQKTLNSGFGIQKLNLELIFSFYEKANLVEDLDSQAFLQRRQLFHPYPDSNQGRYGGREEHLRLYDEEQRPDEYGI